MTRRDLITIAKQTSLADWLGGLALFVGLFAGLFLTGV
jgi:hypothetical protein